MIGIVLCGACIAVTATEVRKKRWLRAAFFGTGIALFALTAASGAAAQPTTSGAAHAVEHAVREEGREPQFTRCRHLDPKHFTCTFFARYYRNGRVRVTYKHGHYYVGEPRYEAPAPYEPVPHA